MVIRVYTSGISGNKEVKKRQQRVTMILDSKNIKYMVIDIAEPGRENDKEFMQENSKAKDSKYPLPPQIFNGDHYCGDYEEFDMANELDELEKFLKISADDLNSLVVENGIRNGSNDSKMDIVKGDSLKEDFHESSEETVSSVNHGDIEAVSLGNDVKIIPEEISHDLDDISKDLDPNITSDLVETPNPPNTREKNVDESDGSVDNDNQNHKAEDDELSTNDSTDEE